MNLLNDARKALVSAIAAATAVEATGFVVGKAADYLHLGIVAAVAAVGTGALTYRVSNGSTNKQTDGLTLNDQEWTSLLNK
jgi:hypothetical protein